MNHTITILVLWDHTIGVIIFGSTVEQTYNRKAGMFRTAAVVLGPQVFRRLPVQQHLNTYLLVELPRHGDQ